MISGRDWGRRAAVAEGVPDSPVSTAKGASRDFVHSRAFEVLSRGGFLARGAIYGIIGILAFLVAVSDKGKLTNQEGAIKTLRDQSFGEVLLVVAAIGLGGYAIWRLFRAALGHGPEASDETIDRLGGLGSGLIYGGLCIATIKVLMGSKSEGASSRPGETTAGVFDWPAGRWLVGIAGLVGLGIGVYQLVKGLRQKFLEELKTDEMSPDMRTWITRIGTVGHVARGVVFGLIGWFLLKAAWEFDAQEAVGLDGALTKILKAAYGPWLLGIVAAGLIAFAAYSISESRYRKI